MSYYNKILASYQVAASETYDLTDYRGDLEADVEVEDFTPGSSGSWHEPASGHEATVRCNGFSFDTKWFDDYKEDDCYEDLEGIFKKIKPGDTLKVKLYGHVGVPEGASRHDEDDVEYEFDTLKVKGVKWEGTVMHVQCDALYSGHGHAPAQSLRGRE